MIKMIYSDAAGNKKYWETWQDGLTVIVHHGLVGETGEVDKHAAGNDPEAMMSRFADEAKNEGYGPLIDDALVTFVVQYQIDGFGTEQDLRKRHDIEDELNEALGWSGNGNCDGGDIGSGSMNVWCYVVDPEIATRTVKATLSGRGYLDGATIAYEADDEYVVVHPRGGEFHIL